LIFFQKGGFVTALIKRFDENAFWQPMGRLGATVAGTIRVLLAAIPKLQQKKGDSK
jgi:hypothetical protein